MIKRIFFILLFLIPIINQSQDYSQLWEGHFSYLDIKDVVESNNKLYAASENAVFIYDIESNVFETISTIQGLSGETISTIYYSESFELLLIGYENGLIEIVQDGNDDILTIIDILEKPTIPPSQKKINHFLEYNEVVYISTNYGISIYDMNNLEFGDTYYIGNGGSQIVVEETVIYDDFIYAVCQNGNGLKKALLISDDLIDYQQWQLISGGNFKFAQKVNEKLYVIRNNKKVYQIENDLLNQVYSFSDNPLDVKTVDNSLVVSTKNDVFVFDDNFNLISNLSVPQEYNVQFTSGVINSNDDVFIGTTALINQGYTGRGVLKANFSNFSEYEEIHPDGPLLNSPFSIEASQGEVWITYGDYSYYYNPYPITRRGISHLIDESWINTPFDSVFEATDLNKITINPENNRQVFISSHKDGILEINDNTPTMLYDQSNSGLESLILPTNPTFTNIRVSGTNFDNQGLLWSVTAVVEKPLKSFNPLSNQWQAYSFNSLIEDPFSNLGFGDLVIDNNGNKWIGSFNYGLIGVKTNGSNAEVKNLIGEAGEGNLPTNNVTAIQIDRRNQLWIGTDKGLRVFYNPESLFSEENVSASEIIILDDGVPSELMYQQLVSDIEVDGSNNKWIGSISTGLFYFSENGQQTIYHFTKDNSPLPSNNILDISIDDSNGKVFIATDKGLVAFNAGGSKPNSDFEGIFVYPNPVRPTFNLSEDKVKIKGISENVNIKITDIEGNLVAEAQSNNNLRYKGYNLEIDGGTAFWNGKNLVNNTVASGVYLVLLSDLDTLETKVLKLMVVR